MTLCCSVDINDMILDEEDGIRSGWTLGHSSTATWRQDCFQYWLSSCFSLRANYTLSVWMVEKWQIVHRRVFHISFMSKCRSEGTNKSDGSFFTKQNTLETFNILDNSNRQVEKWAVFVSSVTLYCLFLRVNIVRRKRIRSPYVRNHFFHLLILDDLSNLLSVFQGSEKKWTLIVYFV